MQQKTEACVDEIAIRIGEEIKRAFALIGIQGHGSNAYIANLCGVTPNAVSRWLNPKVAAKPELKHLLAISQATGVSLDRMVKGEDESGMRVTKIYFRDESERYLPALFDVENGFAVQQNDDSMSSSTGLSLPSGTIMVFSTYLDSLKNQDIVYAEVEYKGESFELCRQYIDSAGRQHLAPLNGKFPMETNFKILGKLAYSIIH